MDHQPTKQHRSDRIAWYAQRQERYQRAPGDTIVCAFGSDHTARRALAEFGPVTRKPLRLIICNQRTHTSAKGRYYPRHHADDG